MSPAMVGIQIPKASTSSNHQSKDDQISLPSMDPSQFNSRIPPPTPSSKPSKPRLMKVRKQSASSSRNKQPPDSIPPPNLIRSSSSSENNTTLHDNLHSWNPFASSEPRVSDSNFNPLCSLENAAFVLGAGGSSLKNAAGFSFGGSSSEGSFRNGPSSLSRNSSQNSNGILREGSFDSMKSESGGDFVFGAPVHSHSRPIDIGASAVAGVFVFGSRESSFGSEEEGSFSKVHEEMRKLNLKNNVQGDSFEKAKQDGDDVASDLPEKMEKLKFGSSSAAANLSVFGNSGKTSSVSSETATMFTTFDKARASDMPESKEAGFGQKVGVDNGFVLRTDSTLHDDMEKLKIQTERRDFDKGKKMGFGQKVDVGSGFVFGSSTNVSGSFGGSAANTLNDNMEKLKIGSENKNSEKSQETAFVFGTSEYVSGSSGGSGANKLNDNMEKLKIGSEKKDSEKPKKTGFGKKVDVGSSNIFGTGDNVSPSFGGGGVSDLHDNMQKFESTSKTENFVGGTSSKFSFQDGIKDQSSNISSIPPFQATTAPPPPPPGPSFQSVGFEFTSKSKDVGSEPPFMEFKTTKQDSKRGGLEPPFMEFKTPKQDASLLTKDNLFTGVNNKMEFSVKKGETTNGARAKKNKGKSRHSVRPNQNFTRYSSSVEGGSHENPEYSPMDYSPYREDIIADQYSREVSVASDDSITFVSRGASADTPISISIDEREEVLTSAAHRLNISEDNLNQEELDDDGSKYHAKHSSSTECSFVYGQSSAYANVGLDGDTRTAPMEAETGPFSSTIERQASDGGIGFIFSSSVDDIGESSFTFSSSPVVPSSSAKRNYRRKSRTKTGPDSYVFTPIPNVMLASSSPEFFPHISTSLPSDSAPGQKDVSFISQNKDDTKAGENRKPDDSQESITYPATVAAQEVWKWRNRGNRAYSNGHLSKAMDYYTHGVNSVSLNEIPNSCIRPLTLCYSNRAASLVGLGRMREALTDCKMAVKLDPNFLRAQVRAANCYLALGEIGAALKHYKKCMQPQKDTSSDNKILSDATEGLQKAQQVADLTGQCAELLLKKTSTDASKALQMISEALSISPHSESLLEMKADALLMMRDYEEVIQLCEQTLDLAEKNSFVEEADFHVKDVYSSESMKSSPARLWRWRLISKSYFHLGKLEEALGLLQKLEKVKPAVDRSPESSTSFGLTIRELLRLKAAGNEAFQASRHSEAVEYYTAALACNAESRPFTAVCFCNRAAAYQALGQITDAIADCSLAIALDASYRKAISRRATLHEMIRDYGQAANDLLRLTSLLERQLEEDNKCGTPGRSSSNISDLKQARRRLAMVEEEARRGGSLDMYMILGVEPLSSAADVKKAYRKAALRHHPDKAGQYLARNENADDGLWREVAGEVHTDADRLFKMIGEAYTILSDPTKRLQYDAEEEMKNTLKKCYNGPSTPKASNDSYNSYYEKGANRRQWRAHGSSYQRW